MENLKSSNQDYIAGNILNVRGHKVILDFHLAMLYNIETRVLKQQVRRNIERFPDDFMLELSKEEWTELITNCDRFIQFRNMPRPPMAFTEQGVAMLSSVLRSSKAIEVNIAIMRTFVKLRRMMETNEELKQKVETMERKYDEHFQVVFKAIKGLVEKKNVPRRMIGFKRDGEGG